MAGGKTITDADKDAARAQWNANPCGADESLSGFKYGSLEFFCEVRRRRYEVTDRWIPAHVPFASVRGKRLLEIGHGMGTDLVTFAEAGADVYGIDITEEHHRLARRNFELHGLTATLKLCDAAAIEFPSNHFDIVYSNGVLHHTPDTVRCISEAYRVLKPGGQLVMALYYTFSAFHLLGKVVHEGLFQGKLRQLGYRGLMATVERGANGIERKPLVKTYSKRELRHILQDFASVRLSIAHFTRDQVPFVGPALPAVVERMFEPVVGWYVIAYATK